MAVCEYKKGNHLASLEHLKNDKLIEKYVSIKYIFVICSHSIIYNIFIYQVIIVLYYIKQIFSSSINNDLLTFYFVSSLKEYSSNQLNVERFKARSNIF